MREKPRSKNLMNCRFILKLFVLVSAFNISGCIYTVGKVNNLIDSAGDVITDKEKIIKYKQLDKYKPDGSILITTEDDKLIIPNINKPILFYVSEYNTYLNKYLFVYIEDMPRPDGRVISYKIPKMEGYTFYSFSIRHAVEVSTRSGWVSGKPTSVLNCNENKPYKIIVQLSGGDQEITVIPSLSSKYQKDLIECSPPGKYG